MTTRPREQLVTLSVEILVRVAVGAIALPIAGVLLWLGGPWSAALFATAGAIAAYEYYRTTTLARAGGALEGKDLAVQVSYLAKTSP